MSTRYNKADIEFGGVALTVEYDWPSGSDLDEMELGRVTLPGCSVDISAVLVAAVLRGASSVGNGFGLTRTDPKRAFWGHICEQVAKEVERDHAADERDRLEDLATERLHLRAA